MQHRTQEDKRRKTVTTSFILVESMYIYYVKISMNTAVPYKFGNPVLYIQKKKKK